MIDLLVGVAGFEPATPSSRTRWATTNELWPVSHRDYARTVQQRCLTLEKLPRYQVQASMSFPGGSAGDRLRVGLG